MPAGVDIHHDIGKDGGRGGAGFMIWPVPRLRRCCAPITSSTGILIGIGVPLNVGVAEQKRGCLSLSEAVISLSDNANDKPSRNDEPRPKMQVFTTERLIVGELFVFVEARKRHRDRRRRPCHCGSGRWEHRRRAEVDALPG